MQRLLLLTVVILIAASLSMRLWRRFLSGGTGPRASADRPISATPWLLFLLPLPVAAAALVSLARGQFIPLLGDALGYGLFLGAAFLVRRARLSTGRWPSKTLGGVLVGLATGTTAWLGIGHPPAIAVAFALIALLGCYLTYGVDRLTGRGIRNRPGVGEHARTALAQADRSIAAIEQAIREIRQPELHLRLRRIAELARAILGRLEEDPRDLHRARKFLNVYLDGVQRVVEGYAKTHERIDAPELDERFRRALITVEDVFREQQQTLLESDVDQLDVQIDVLTQQLEREGIV